jgi:hypothetical protein
MIFLAITALVLALSLLTTSPGALAGDDASRVEARLEVKPITSEERDHWSFRPVRRPRIPALPAALRDWARNPIDAFVAAGLQANGLSPAPEADRPTLLRRLSFDLTGLPPSPEELDAFVADSSQDAYDRVVGRLLASPQYGERWAQHWLDLARYADTDGFEFDQERPNAWRYRDWVVDAINRDLPYDQFVRLQLAGDEIAPDDPEAFIATGFNRCYPDMVDLNDQGLRRQNALNDITETTGLVFLGLTIGCARCHDHKFDPIRQADFYRLQAFFAPARFRDDYPIASADRRRAHEEAVGRWRAAIAAEQAAILRIESPVRARIAPGLPMGALDSAVAAFNKPESERSPAEVESVFNLLHHDRRIKADAWPRLLSDGELAERQQHLVCLDQIRRKAPVPLPTARGLDEDGGNPPPTYFLRRGDYASKGPVVSPAFPAVLTAAVQTEAEISGETDGASPGETPALPASTTRGSSGRRLALANWLTRPDHPLTARVMVNRIWQGHFGRGLVDTPSDFGTMGAEPSLPELLDWLASEFVARGWSAKDLHRLIVSSATYRTQSVPASPEAAGADPDNTWLAHQNRRRLDGEAIRDALLAVSGRLNPSRGGPGVFPPLPAELTRLSSKGAIWPVSSKPADQNRRSLYVFVRRNLRYPFFEAFDRPDTNASCPKRPVTTIAPQALSLLNSELSTKTARALAGRAEREAASRSLALADPAHSDARIERAYRIALGRPPHAAEIAMAHEFLDSNETSFADFCLALINLNEFIYID